MSLQPFFLWMQEHAFSAYILNETWFSPIVQVMHLIALAVFAGAVLVVDLRLLGVGLTRVPLSKVSEDAMPWMVWGLVALLITGWPSVMSTAMKQYYSPFFWWKMQIIVIGLLFNFTIRRRVAFAEEGTLGHWPKVVGFLSIGIWTSVSVYARLIGLLS